MRVRAQGFPQESPIGFRECTKAQGLRLLYGIGVFSRLRAEKGLNEEGTTLRYRRLSALKMCIRIRY